MNVFFIIDICLNFFTAYFDTDMELVDDPKVIIGIIYYIDNCSRILEDLVYSRFHIMYSIRLDHDVW